jgi:hypothetical protein
MFSTPFRRASARTFAELLLTSARVPRDHVLIPLDSHCQGLHGGLAANDIGEARWSLPRVVTLPRASRQAVRFHQRRDAGEPASRPERAGGRPEGARQAREPLVLPGRVQ